MDRGRRSAPRRLRPSRARFPWGGVLELWGRGHRSSQLSGRGQPGAGTSFGIGAALVRFSTFGHGQSAPCLGQVRRSFGGGGCVTGPDNPHPRSPCCSLTTSGDVTCSAVPSATPWRRGHCLFPRCRG
jgi:hypothetical protein